MKMKIAITSKKINDSLNIKTELFGYYHCCHKFGHKDVDCRTRGKDQSLRRKQDTNTSNDRRPVSKVPLFLIPRLIYELGQTRISTFIAILFFFTQFIMANIHWIYKSSRVRCPLSMLFKAIFLVHYEEMRAVWHTLSIVKSVHFLEW